MRKTDRKAIETIRDCIQIHMEEIEAIRDRLTVRAEVEILTDVAGNLKEAIDHLGEV